MLHTHQLIELLQSKAAKLINVNPANTLQQNANNLSNPTTTVLRHSFLSSKNAVTLVILPFKELIDFKKMDSLIGSPASIIPYKDCSHYYINNDKAHQLPLKPKNTDKIFIAESVHSYEFVIFESAKAGTLIQTTAEQLATLIQHSQFYSFSEKAPAIELKTPYTSNQKQFTPDKEKRQQLERLYKLPAMPQMANELIIIKNDDKAHVCDLARIIQQDPSLSAQIIRHAKSAFFNYQGDINSVNEAISRVLGFNSAINICLGLSLSKKLKNPPDGPLGLNEFWKHAIYSATLAQSLSKHLPKATRPRPDLAYLCGLLHNIGFLLLGHLFQPEFFLLNRLYAANLTSSITCIEKHALGMGAGQSAINMGHSELGAWLLEKWGLPEETITTARQHHSFNYSGQHSHYSSLIGLVNNALGLHDLGDHREETLNEDLCIKLNIKPSVVLNELDTLMEETNEIEMTIKQFVA